MHKKLQKKSQHSAAIWKRAAASLILIKYTASLLVAIAEYPEEFEDCVVEPVEWPY